MTVSPGVLARACAAAALASLFVLPVPASDPPDSKINHVDGLIETADSAKLDGSYDIRHVATDEARATRRVTVVTTDPLDDLGPRLAVSAAGDTWIAWWRDADPDLVLVRRRNRATGEWGPEIVLGDRGAGKRNPEIVHDGTRAWVVYESDRAAGGTAIAVAAIGDEPNPVGWTVAEAADGFAGDRDARIHAEAGHVWVTWIDGAASLGWSEFDHASGTWGAEAYEPVSTDGVDAARGRIRAAVAGE